MDRLVRWLRTAYTYYDIYIDRALLSVKKQTVQQYIHTVARDQEQEMKVGLIQVEGLKQFE